MILEDPIVLKIKIRPPYFIAWPFSPQPTENMGPDFQGGACGRSDCGEILTLE